jgi:hypothetical protein
LVAFPDVESTITVALNYGKLAKLINLVIDTSLTGASWFISQDGGGKHTCCSILVGKVQCSTAEPWRTQITQILGEESVELEYFESCGHVKYQSCIA